MNLSECLLQRDVQVLQELATEYECECVDFSKLDLVQTLHHQMLHRDKMSRILYQMDEELIYFVTYLLFQPQQVYNYSQLKAKGRTVADLLGGEKSPATWISHLIKIGWLLRVSNRHRQSGINRLEIPRDLLHLLQQELKKYWQGQMNQLQKPDTFSIKKEERDGLSFDIQTFLYYTYHNHVPLTKDGVLYKKDQHELFTYFSVQEESLQDVKWRFGYGRRFPYYPNRFALIYDYVYDKGWLRETTEGLYLTASGVEHLKNGYIYSQTCFEECFQFWLHTYQKPISTLPFVVHWMKACLLDSWIQVDELFRVIQVWLKPYYFDDASSMFRERIVQMLLHLGQIQLAYDEQTANWYIKRSPSSIENKGGM